MDSVRHAAYAAGWKKFEPLWDAVIRARRLAAMLPLLEGILSGFGARSSNAKHLATVREAAIANQAVQ